MKTNLLNKTRKTYTVKSCLHFFFVKLLEYKSVYFITSSRPLFYVFLGRMSFFLNAPLAPRCVMLNGKVNSCIKNVRIYIQSSCSLIQLPKPCQTIALLRRQNALWWNLHLPRVVEYPVYRDFTCKNYASIVRHGEGNRKTPISKQTNKHITSKPKNPNC